jgi:hypothetical protein
MNPAMTTFRASVFAGSLLALACWLPSPALAARAAPPCTGYIDAVPAVITSRGRWCLRKHLGTAMSSGAAITIAAHDVTIDCDRYRINGVEPGEGAGVTGIRATNRDNVRIQRCLVTGFRIGIGLSGARPLVEDSLVAHATHRGIDVAGTAGEIRDNTISFTGGDVVPPSAQMGIRTQGTIDVLDNRVHDIHPNLVDTATGIGLAVSDNPGGLVQGNTIIGAATTSVPGPVGIRITGSPGAFVRGNHIQRFDRGIDCDTPEIVAQDNGMKTVGDAAPGCTVRGSVAIAARPLPSAGRVPVEVRNCDAYIDTLPAIIDTPGNYCLRANLSTPIAAGFAIRGTTRRVFIDCRGFRVSGIAGGADSTAEGIRLEDGHGAVRNCHVRGFGVGIFTAHDYQDISVVEDNRIEGAGRYGISSGPMSHVRRNHVIDAGGSADQSNSRVGILDGHFVEDNIVDGVLPPAGLANKPAAIGLLGRFTFGNRVRDVAAADGAVAIGLQASYGSFAEGNTVSAVAVGIQCSQTSLGRVFNVGGNVLMQTPTPLGDCTDAGNTVVP